MKKHFETIFILIFRGDSMKEIKSKKNLTNINIIFILLFLIATTGCSFTKSDKKNASHSSNSEVTALTSISDEVNLTETEKKDAAELLLDNTTNNLSSSNYDLSGTQTLKNAGSSTYQSSSKTSRAVNSSKGYKSETNSANDTDEVKLSKETKTYKVEKGDTLMLISFKLYGNYLLWKKIARLNPGIKLDKGIVTVGQELKYYPPLTPFVWEPQGNPYLIQIADTLSRISKKVYQDYSKWKLIWDNNKPLIRDPNLIFAGMTLYYLSLNDVKSGVNTAKGNSSAEESDTKEVKENNNGEE